jgi:hypothetical protein
VRLECTHDADMRKTARRAAAEYQPDCRSCTFEADTAGVDRFACNLNIAHCILAILPGTSAIERHFNTAIHHALQ